LNKDGINFKILIKIWANLTSFNIINGNPGSLLEDFPFGITVSVVGGQTIESYPLANRRTD
jgi:hypothetical protein